MKECFFLNKHLIEYDLERKFREASYQMTQMYDFALSVIHLLMYETFHLTKNII